MRFQHDVPRLPEVIRVGPELRQITQIHSPLQPVLPILDGSGIKILITPELVDESIKAVGVAGGGDAKLERQFLPGLNGATVDFQSRIGNQIFQFRIARQLTVFQIIINVGSAAQFTNLPAVRRTVESIPQEIALMVATDGIGLFLIVKTVLGEPLLIRRTAAHVRIENRE